MTYIIRIAVALLVVLVCDCQRGRKKSPASRLRLATTTSTENSGLLDYLLPDFEREHGIGVHVLSVGTGKALKLAENGDVDVVLVHAPAAEKRFVTAGHGVGRTQVMYNEFAIVGPPGDPAGVKKTHSAAAAMSAIARAEARFVSRGDDSGTHMRERQLWKSARLSPGGGWYLEVGQGMAAALRVADEKDAYCLTDYATYLSYSKKPRLVPLLRGDPELRNVYSVIAVNPRRHPNTNRDGATAFIGWLTSSGTQKKIGAFVKHGEVLFRPLAQ